MKATSSELQELERIYQELDFFVQAADSEAWPDSITRNRKAFNALVKLQRNMEKATAQYLDGLAERAPQFVNWTVYQERMRKAGKQADELTVSVNATLMEAERKILLKVLFDFIVEGEMIAGRAAASNYRLPISDLDLAAAVQREAINYSANLVKGITNTTRDAIRTSVGASLELGENITEATARLQSVIDNPARAAMISHTESVNSWGAGINTFGKTTGAKGKVWDSVIDDKTSPICVELERLYGEPKKAIPVDEPYKSSYVGEIDSPGAHPWCRSSQYLIY